MPYYKVGDFPFGALRESKDGLVALQGTGPASHCHSVPECNVSELPHFLGELPCWLNRSAMKIEKLLKGKTESERIEVLQDLLSLKRKGLVKITDGEVELAEAWLGADAPMMAGEEGHHE